MKLRDADLSWQDLDEEIVVLDLGGSTYLRLNGTGATLWRRLSEGAERDDLVATLTSEYEVEASRAEQDVNAFLAQLEDKRLLDRNG